LRAIEPPVTSGRCAEGEPEEIFLFGVEIEKLEASIAERNRHLLAGKLRAYLCSDAFSFTEGYHEA
jgi:hypothetical protein